MSSLRSLRHLKQFVNAIGANSFVCLKHSEHIAFLPTSLRLGPLSAERNVKTFSSSTLFEAKKRDSSKGKKTKVKVALRDEEINQVIEYEKFIQEMDRVVQNLNNEFEKRLTLRTTPAAFESLMVETPDGKFQLSEIARVFQKTPSLLEIQMIDFPQFITNATKTISASGLNVNPQQDKTSVFIKIPKVTREHREQLVKNAKTLCNGAREKLRDIHNKYSREVKKSEGELEEDLLYNVGQLLKAKQDEYATKLESLAAAKQKELQQPSS